MKLVILSFLLSTSIIASAKELLPQQQNPWYQQGQRDIEQANRHFAEINPKPGAAKNIILFVGDGMSIVTVAAARINDGQNKGQHGEEHCLSFEKFPFSGFSKTYNINLQVPDSAGTMTAMMTGIKTDAGIINVNEQVVKGDCASQQGNELLNALELAELNGKATGIVTTTRITHATPAATYANAASRDWENDASMPALAKQQGCVDIARQLVEFIPRLHARFPQAKVDGLDVVMGGGRQNFLPMDKTYNSNDFKGDIEGRRTDNRNLIAQWQQQFPKGVYVDNLQSFQKLTVNNQKVLGLFNPSHMHYQADRHNDVAGEPSLVEMTRKAIEILSKNSKGFFLMVESGRIDHAHHAGNAFNALNDTIALSDAVQAAYEATNKKDTLIIVTADHGHVMTMSGYPKRGNPILGKVVGLDNPEPTKAQDGLPYTTLSYMNGRGFADLGQHSNANRNATTAVNAGRKDLRKVDTTAPGFHQEALVPLSSETHSGEDVAIYASGPGAHLVTGVHEQSFIFHVMDRAGGLSANALKKLQQNKK